jgi:hypothetical protein
MTETQARHCMSVWHYLNDHSDDQKRYLGKLTDVFEELNISRTYYTPIWRVLEQGGYVSKVQRGGGGNPSAIVVHTKPSLDALLLTDIPEESSVPLVRRVEHLESATGGIDIPAVLASMELRLKIIEAAVGITTAPYSEPQDTQKVEVNP